MEDCCKEMNEFELTKKDVIQSIKRQCKNHILSVYPVEIQLSISLGMYSLSFENIAKKFIQDCIHEENRITCMIRNCITKGELRVILQDINWPKNPLKGYSDE